MNIIFYYESPYSYAQEQLEESVFNSGLNHLASELFMYGLNNSDTLDSAIRRAMMICRSVNIPVRRNFRPVYSFKNGEMISDWRLTDLARKLVLLNGDPENPFVARLQVELINKI